MTPQERLDEINRTLEAIRTGWPSFLAVMQERAASLTEQLIGQDNEQTRGRLKQLRELMELPATLTQERDELSDGIAE